MNELEMYWQDEEIHDIPYLSYWGFSLSNIWIRIPSTSP